MRTFTRLETAFIEAFIEASLFCGVWDGGDEPIYDPDHDLVSQEFMQATEHITENFFAAFGNQITNADLATQAGHDFWLSMQRHGTGFWDREDTWGDYADKMHEYAQKHGWEDSPYFGDDGLIYP